MEIKDKLIAALFRLLTISLIALTVSSANARENIFRYGGIGENDGPTEWLRGVKFEWEAAMNVSTLVGEPVVDARFRWLVIPGASKVEIPSFRGAEDPYTTIDLPSLGYEAAEKIVLIQAKVVFFFKGPSGFGQYGILSDVGVVENPDGTTWSFNVAGSPNWNEFIFDHPPGTLRKEVLDSDYFSEDQAKSLYKGGLEFSHAVLWDAELTFYDLHNWYAQYTSAPEIVATQKAYRRAATRVQRSFGYDVQAESGAVRARFENASQNNFIGKARIINSDFHTRLLDNGRNGLQIPAEAIYRDDLTKRYVRLSSLPREFTRKGDTVAYRREMKLISEELARDIERARGWMTSEKNPDDYPRGVETEANYVEAERIYLFESLEFLGSGKQQDMVDLLNVWKFLYPDVGFSMRLIDRRSFKYSACIGKYCNNSFITARITARCSVQCPKELFTYSPPLPKEGSEELEKLKVLWSRMPTHTSIDYNYTDGGNDFSKTNTIAELNAIMNRMDIKDYRIKPIEGEFAIP